MMKRTRIVCSWLVTALFFSLKLYPQQTSILVPPNEPAHAVFENGILTLSYNGHTIFTGNVDRTVEELRFKTQVFSQGDKIQGICVLTSIDWSKKIRISGTVTGSGESFPCEVDRPSRGPLIVRHSSGLSHSLRNRAVYDRNEDWVFSVDANPNVVVAPSEESADRNNFSISIEGSEIVIRFRPRYYQKHRGLEFFEPWTYKVWSTSVAGWISWFAFYDKVSERDMVETADVFSEVLKPFGDEYFQMDDGYQRGKGDPNLWLNPNSKFPHGLKYLADYIKSRGLKPGIWTGVSVDEQELVDQHPSWFVHDQKGKPVRGNWIDFVLDASNPEALANVVQPLYKGLREQGWEYFKMDALRHLRYEGYNTNRDYFERKGVNLVDAYRDYAKTVRSEIGRDHFMLGCWGIRPELVGIIDGCRIGDDGFSYAGLAQYNSFNNVVWRNDPDHIELNEDAFRSTMVTSLTGSLFMLTDKPAVYRTPVIEPAKRTVPVLFTRPGQIYDVDPSRSQNISQVNAEVSGSGPRLFDAGYTPDCFLYLLEINRPFGSWDILGRTGGDYSEIRFADLGLDPGRQYYVFEFWSKNLLGSFDKSFHPGPIDPKFKSQAFCIRERTPYPQLIATSRHITCGGIDLSDLRWDYGHLSGKSALVRNDPYVLYLTEPSGYHFEDIQCINSVTKNIERQGLLVKITFLSDKSTNIGWIATYSKQK